MHRAFSSLTLRAVHEDERVLEGIASTPRPDRMSDVVESNGVQYQLPIPLLLDHNHTQAVGEVEHVEVSDTGIRFLARIKKIAEPGAAKDLVDRAWSLIKHGLRSSVSIGFRPIDSEAMPSGGLRFKTWEWLELSCVAVPAQPDARITSAKSAVVRLREPAATHVVRLTEKELRMGKIIADAKGRADARARLGIPNAVVRL